MQQCIAQHVEFDEFIDGQRNAILYHAVTYVTHTLSRSTGIARHSGCTHEHDHYVGICSTSAPCMAADDVLRACCAEARVHLRALHRQQLRPLAPDGEGGGGGEGGGARVPARVVPTTLLPVRVVPTRVAPARVVPARTAPTRGMPARAVPTSVAPESAVPAWAMMALSTITANAATTCQ